MEEPKSLHRELQRRTWGWTIELEKTEYRAVTLVFSLSSPFIFHGQSMAVFARPSQNDTKDCNNKFHPLCIITCRHLPSPNLPSASQLARVLNTAPSPLIGPAPPGASSGPFPYMSLSLSPDFKCSKQFSNLLRSPSERQKKHHLLIGLGTKDASCGQVGARPSVRVE